MLRLGIVGLGLAHELNSPLTTLAMGLELLEEQLRKDPPPSLEQIARMVARQRAGVERMAALVDHMRALATGRGQGVERFALDTVIDAVFELTRPALRELDGAALHRGPRAATLFVRADQILVEQAICCLVLNGADASGTEGSVTVSLAQAGDGIEIQVRDSGPGFDDIEAALTVGATSKGTRGMGVGLALVATIVEQAGGELRLANHPDGGAVATLVLPSVDSAS